MWSNSSEGHVYMTRCLVVSDSAILWTAAHQASLSMGLSRQDYWSGLPCSLLGDLPNLGIRPPSSSSLALGDGFFTTEPRKT